MNNSSTIFLNLPPALKEIIGIKKNWYSITSGKSGTRIYKIEDPIHKQFGLYLKIASIKNDRNLIIEAEKLRWLRGKLPVPEVLFSTEVGSIQYLLLTEIPGVPSFNAVFQNNLTYLVKLLAKGLNMVHSIPIIGCPFKRTLDLQIKLVQERINNGLVHEENFDVIRKGRTVQNLFEELVATRPISEDVVFTHGDYCLPNIIIKGTEISGFVDLGNAGIADRYQDLALGVRSLSYNFDQKLVPLFFEEYGLKTIDRQKLEFYQLLDEFF